MWKRDDATKPGEVPGPPGPAAARPSAGNVVGDRPPEAAGRPESRDTWNVGKSVVVTGELSGNENVFIEGQVEGKIELRNHVLTVGPNGKIKAQVVARQVVVLGEVVGNITATEKVAIQDNGAVDGDLVAPRVAIAEGAHFRGSIDMQRRSAPTAATAGTTARPAAKAASAATGKPPRS